MAASLAWQDLDDDSAPPGLEPANNGQNSQQGTAKSMALTQLVQPGQPVEFTVAASSHDKVKNKGSRAAKYVAKEASTGSSPAWLAADLTAPCHKAKSPPSMQLYATSYSVT